MTIYQTPAGDYVDPHGNPVSKKDAEAAIKAAQADAPKTEAPKAKKSDK